jgi:hypothetical protein
MKQLSEFLIGLVLLIIGAVILLQNVVVNSFSLLYRINNVSVGGILLLLIAVAFVITLVKPSPAAKYILVLLILVFFICLIASLNIRIARMTGLKLILILGTICVGIALMIRATLSSK